jgi:cobalt-zinc-cadmium efflux system membrane fusion protein
VSCLFILLLIAGVQSSVLAADHDHESEQHEQHKDADEASHNHGEHEKDEEHGEHEGHEEPELKFSAAELQEFSIKLDQAQAGVINKTLNLTGEVIVAPERLYHVVPRVSGVVRQAFKHLGDEVKAGDLLATLSSRDLADAKAEFVAADSLLKLANSNLKRERDLYKSKVTAKREYLAARQVQAEMSIKRKAAEQRLSAIGLTEKSILSVLRNVDKDLTLYELRAPADGVIIEKHAAQGEVLENNNRSFTVADLSQVWVNLTVYQKDLPFIHQGQKVSISTRFGGSDKQTIAMSHISWLSPVLDEKTRSATARIVIENSDGHWRPGLFVNAIVAIEKTQAEIVIPLTALQTVEGQTIVFVQHEDGDFEPQAVQTGRRDFQQVEITQGLKPGQTYVSQNAFSLKAQLQKGEFSEGHSH